MQISSLAKYVLDNDQLGALRRYLREDPIDETTALMDDILEVGIGGHFLARRSTRAYSRSEVWRPQVFQRGTFEEYRRAGRSLPRRPPRGPARSWRLTRCRRCPTTRSGTSTRSSRGMRRADPEGAVDLALRRRAAPAGGGDRAVRTR